MQVSRYSWMSRSRRDRAAPAEARPRIPAGVRASCPVAWLRGCSDRNTCSLASMFRRTLPRSAPGCHAAATADKATSKPLADSPYRCRLEPRIRGDGRDRVDREFNPGPLSLEDRLGLLNGTGQVRPFIDGDQRLLDLVRGRSPEARIRTHNDSFSRREGSWFIVCFSGTRPELPLGFR
jgi:hypothetical protein